MKKILMLLAAASIIVSAIGCSKPAEEAGTTGATATTGSTGATDQKTPDATSDK